MCGSVELGCEWRPQSEDCGGRGSKGIKAIAEGVGRRRRNAGVPKADGGGGGGGEGFRQSGERLLRSLTTVSDAR